jgi:hypothetical protein
MPRPGSNKLTFSDGTIAEGAPGWAPPSRPLVTVVRALRVDLLGRTHARRQIDLPNIWALVNIRRFAT